ncbi:uncharacterized protein LOC134277396 [Saccostrea cucullata]|uniref:uncharacterized protein LOC134277396 n=1 Tax=Saccostrea cuccullata TaxID=36930 RepID=UPI002ED5ED3D
MSTFLVTVIVLCLLIFVLAIIVLLLRCLFKKQQPIPGSATRVVGVRRLSADNETYHVTMFPHSYILTPQEAEMIGDPDQPIPGFLLSNPKHTTHSENEPASRSTNKKTPEIARPSKSRDNFF